jgi:hypothetical protein
MIKANENRQIPLGHVRFAGKSFCSRLRDFGCPDTLIKDVRDVAAAASGQRGAGTSRGTKVESTEESGSSKAEAALIASKAKPARLYSGT